MVGDHAQSVVNRADLGDDGVDPGGLECEAGDFVHPSDEGLLESGGDVVNAGGHVVKADGDGAKASDDVIYAGGDVASSGRNGDAPGKVVEDLGEAEDDPV
jgi:hypothetical protein